MRRLAVLALLSLAACGEPKSVVDLRRAQAFMAAVSRAPGVVTLPSGLAYKVLRSGPASGASPQPTDHVLVAYEGRLIDGQVFDSSYQHGAPAVMQVNELIPAWTEALEKMHPGDAWMLYVPPQLGYGPQATGPIPPNSALIFKVELLTVLPADVSVGKG
jgi:peptidylprolyl isomerase/FKBP-type peptidyl-prolyl cis-trans isomerase FklB